MSSCFWALRCSAATWLLIALSLPCRRRTRARERGRSPANARKQSPAPALEQCAAANDVVCHNILSRPRFQKQNVVHVELFRTWVYPASYPDNTRLVKRSLFNRGRGTDYPAARRARGVTTTAAALSNAHPGDVARLDNAVGQLPFQPPQLRSHLRRVV